MALRLGLDTGGTFTDLIGLYEDGRPVVNKVPSTLRNRWRDSRGAGRTGCWGRD